MNMISLVFIEGISICIVGPIVGYVVVREFYKYKGEWKTKEKEGSP